MQSAWRPGYLLLDGLEEMAALPPPVCLDVPPRGLLLICHGNAAVGDADAESLRPLAAHGLQKVPCIAERVAENV
eukprot:4288620-Lingulodinium_polyedra.AAC.1